MPNKATRYIALITILGFMVLVGCLVFRAEFPDLPRYFSYLLLAVLASTLKVRLPLITGTMSVNFLFILTGIADSTLAETMQHVTDFWRAMPPGQKAAGDDLAAVLPVVFSVLSGWVRNSWSSHCVEPCRRLAGIAAGAAADVSGLSLLPVLPATDGTRTADRGLSDCLTFPQQSGPKGPAPLSSHSVFKRHIIEGLALRLEANAPGT